MFIFGNKSNRYYLWESYKQAVTFNEITLISSQGIMETEEL